MKISAKLREVELKLRKQKNIEGEKGRDIKLRQDMHIGPARTRNRSESLREKSCLEYVTCRKKH